MKVKLLKDKEEGQGQLKTTVRRNRGQVIGWLKGTEIEVSEATGEKLIAAGEAVKIETPVDEPAETAEEEK